MAAIQADQLGKFAGECSLAGKNYFYVLDPTGAAGKLLSPDSHSGLTASCCDPEKVPPLRVSCPVLCSFLAFYSSVSSVLLGYYSLSRPLSSPGSLAEGGEGAWRADGIELVSRLGQAPRDTWLSRSSIQGRALERAN